MRRLLLDRQPPGFTVLLWCSLIFLLVACRPAQPEVVSDEMDLKLTVTSDKQRYKVNEAIFVTVSLYNVGTESQTVNGRLLLNHSSAPDSVRDLYFEIAGPDGYSNRNLFRVNAGNPQASDLVELASGGVHQRVIELTRFHSLHLSGQYTLTAHYLSAVPVAGFNVWQGSLQSEPLHLERR